MNQRDETTVVPDAGPTQACGLAWSETYDCDDDYTIIKPPPITGTMAADALEPDDWDDSDWTDDDAREYASTTVKMFVGLMAVVVIAAGWISYVFLTHHHDDNATAPATSTAAPPAQSSPDDTVAPSAAPAPTPTPSSPDNTIESTPTAAPAPTSTVTVTQTPEPQAAPTVTAETPPPPPVAPAPRRSAADEAFMSSLREDGIIVTNPTEVIANAHGVCQYIAAGHTAHEAMRSAMADNRTLTLENAATLIGAAIGAYCPQYTGM
jgi:hypothetical protein